MEWRLLTFFMGTILALFIPIVPEFSLLLVILLLALFFIFINKFINNVESRIYAQISKNLVDGMFEEDGALSGTAELEGATIYWVKDVTAGTITVQITEADGSFTELVVPLTGFGF